MASSKADRNDENQRLPPPLSSAYPSLYSLVLLLQSVDHFPYHILSLRASASASTSITHVTHV